MTKNLADVFIVPPLDDLQRFSARVAIAGAVKAVPHQSLLDPFIRSGVNSGRFRKRPVEGRIEHCELRDALAEGFTTGTDAFQICGIVQRCQLAEPVDGCLNSRCNHRGAAKFQAAMHNTVADEVDLVRIFKHGEITFPRRLNQCLDLVRQRPISGNGQLPLPALKT